MSDINGPRAEFDWTKATVRVKVPLLGTASVKLTEQDIPLANFWALVQLRSAEERAAMRHMVDEHRRALASQPLPSELEAQS